MALVQKVRICRLAFNLPILQAHTSSTARHMSSSGSSESSSAAVKPGKRSAARISCPGGVWNYIAFAKRTAARCQMPLAAAHMNRARKCDGRRAIPSLVNVWSWLLNMNGGDVTCSSSLAALVIVRDCSHPFLPWLAWLTTGGSSCRLLGTFYIQSHTHHWWHVHCSVLPSTITIHSHSHHFLSIKRDLVMSCRLSTRTHVFKTSALCYQSWASPPLQEEPVVLKKTVTKPCA